MKRGKRGQRKKASPKLGLNLPDLDQAKSAVLNSLWNHVCSRLARSMGGSRRLLTKLPIPACSARISLRASAESKGRRTPVFDWETGSPPIRQRRSGRCLIRIRSRESEIERCLGPS